MTDPGRQLRAKIEMLGSMAGADLEPLARHFRAEVQALTCRFHDRPDELTRKVGEAAASFQQKITAATDRLHARLNVCLGTRPAPPRRPFVEKFPPRPPKPRGGKRPSAGGVVVKPDSPKGLSGGAAAALEFD
jgi:hypothetical protein